MRQTKGLGLLITNCLILFSAVPFLGSGCANVHLYDQASLNTALKAQSAFTNANLSAGLEAERKLMSAVASREHTVVERQALATRNAAILEIVGQTNAEKSWQTLGTVIDKRIRELTGLDNQGRSNLLEDINQLQNHQGTLDDDALIYNSLSRTNGDPDLPKFCNDEKAVADVRSKISSKEERVVFDEWYKECTNVLAKENQITNLYASNKTGLIGKATEDIDQIQKAQNVWNVEYANRKAAFDAAKAAYDSVTTNKGALMGAALALSDALSRLDMKDATSASEQLDKLGFKGLGLEGTLTQITEQQSAIVAAAAYLSSTNTRAPVPTNSALFLTLLPVIKAVGDKFDHPPALHLYLAQEHLRIKATEIQNQINSAEAELKLKMRKREVLTTELMLLNQANLFWANVASNSPPADQVLAKWVTSAKPEISRPTIEALADYASAWTLGRVEEELIDYQVIDTRHAAALDSSDTALQSWNNLISTPVQQVIVYYGSGIKPETIANLIGAAGISAAIVAK